MSRIYVASLAAYNSGTLHGAWIDLDDCTDVDDIQTAVAAMLADDPHHGEEWAIHDHEGFEGITINEYESFDNVLMHSQMLAERGPAWAAFVGYVGAQSATAEGFEDAAMGEYSSGADFAQGMAEDCGDLDGMPEMYANHIDWEQVWENEFPNHTFVETGYRSGFIFSGV